MIRSPVLFPIILALLGCAATPAVAQIAVRNQGYIPFSDAPINYRSNDLHDPVAQLQQQLDGGKANLEYEPTHGYLRSVLKLLQVPISSQTLVFSKTSFQYPKISPEHPRALYFNDDVYVGSVHEGKAIEIVSFDPMQGAIFYLLDERKVDKPVFQRAELDCTQCHIAAGTRGIPGVLLRSVYPESTGILAAGAHSFITDQESPLSERWGGWYVTGDAAAGSHMGNAVVDKRPAESASDAHGAAFKLVALSSSFDPSTYLSPDSDVVAHLVLAHQTQMHNLITLTNYKTRIALYSEGAATSDAAKTPGDSGALPDSVRQKFERPAEQLLRYLLFVNEAPLPFAPTGGIGSTSQFAREFAARASRDPKGRSLRDFDLKTRIFRYPCSYLIYSDSFESLPEPAKGYVYRRLLEILTGRDQSPDFTRLSGEDRRAILEILLATKPGLPAEWRDYARANHISGADGRWDASLIQQGNIIPFRLDISGSGSKLQGTLYDGFEPYEHTTSASFENGKLVLNIEHYLTTITATVQDGQLTGTVTSHSRDTSAEYGFRATRHVTTPAATDAPSIAGSWEIPLDTPSSKGEKAFRFIVRQNGPEVAASILRVDGDTGAYSGTYQDGHWVLSHFDGSRPGVIVVSLTHEGTLEILQNPDRAGQPGRVDGSNAASYAAVKTSSAAPGYDNSPADGRYASRLVAYRPEAARAKGLPEPDNYLTHTTARDPQEKFTFNFPDVDGKLVSNEDPRFKGKVVLAIVTGTWCPNCHDEAQYLVQLDKKYRDKGLAIVALDFEEPEQQGSLERERAFVKQYGVKYTYLIAGAPAEMWEKVPQLVNLNTWPATVFIGRDGHVKAVHSGFASPASGEFNRQLKQEFTSRIEQLLTEKAPPEVSSTAAAAAAAATRG